MTFDDFQSTRTWSDDLSADIPTDANLEGARVPQGNVYLGCLYIERVQADWPAETRAMGGWHLLIANCEWVTDDLNRLEHILYEWAVDEGYGAVDEGAASSGGADMAGNVYAYFASKLGRNISVQDQNELQWLTELSLDTECGRDCMRAIDAGALLLEIAEEASPVAETLVVDAIEEIVLVFWRG